MTFERYVLRGIYRPRKGLGFGMLIFAAQDEQWVQDIAPSGQIRGFLPCDTFDQSKLTPLGDVRLRLHPECTRDCLVGGAALYAFELEDSSILVGTVDELHGELRCLAESLRQHPFVLCDLARFLGDNPLAVEAAALCAKEIERSRSQPLALFSTQAPRSKSGGADAAQFSRAATPAWKRVMDLCVCLFLFPLLSPVALLMIILTKTCSPGPVMIRQERVGFRGRRFKRYIFRTNHVNALDAAAKSPYFFGANLVHKLGLDELPQIVNVLRGEMTLVGPLACLPEKLQQFGPSQMERFNALPGMTGLWQVSGHWQTTFEEMVRLDIRYIREISFVGDLKILFQTPLARLQEIFDELEREGKRTASPQENVAPVIVTVPKTVFEREEAVERLAAVNRARENALALRKGTEIRLWEKNELFGRETFILFLRAYVQAFSRGPAST